MALVLALALGAAFVLVERRTAETILPLEIVRHGTVAASLVCAGVAWWLLYAAISFVPLFVQGVIGTSATSSGAVLIPVMLATITASALTGQLIARTGRTRPNAIVGATLLLAGELLVWRMDPSTTRWEVVRNVVTLGFGIGLMTQVFLLSVQSAVPRAALGSATALMQFARMVGASIGVALMGVVVNHGLVHDAGVEIDVGRGGLDLAGRAELAAALRPAFFVGVCGAALALVLVLVAVEDVPLGGRRREESIESVVAEARVL
jgi:hypothetical protein